MTARSHTRLKRRQKRSERQLAARRRDAEKAREQHDRRRKETQ